MTIDGAAPAPSAPRLSAASAARRHGLEQFWLQLKRWIVRRRTARQLSELSDEMLKDIGVSRSGIELTAVGPRYPSRPDRYI